MINNSNRGDVPSLTCDYCSLIIRASHPPPVPIFWYIGHFDLEKKRRRLSGRSVAVSRRNLARSTFALRWGDSAGGTSLPEGEINIITNNSPILGRAISINIFNSTISSQTLVHLFVVQSCYRNYRLVLVGD